MSPNLTRKELYELVWTKPRSQIAKELGVSDVWINKMCRRMNVPAPPRGYWANLAAGSRRRRKYVKPPLPYSVVERIEEEHQELAACFAGFDPKDFDQPVPPPPVIPHTLEESLARYRQLVDALPMPKAQVSESLAEAVPADVLGKLPNLQYFASVSGGRLIKGRFPILDPGDGGRRGEAKPA